MSTLMHIRENLTIKKLGLPLGVMAAFWMLAVIIWQTSGYWQPLLFFGYIGAAVSLGLGLYAVLPKQKKPLGRRISLLLVGSFLLVMMGLVQSENMQIEWVFLSLLAGTSGAVLSHYLIAKVFGPLLFGRLWCGWACWTVMILDLLPYKRALGRVPGKWGWLRYTHFGLSFLLMFALWAAFGYAQHAEYGSRMGLVWMVAGNALYYAVGIGLAVILKDNRAFCKYLCPVSVPLKITTRFSLLKIKGDAQACNECNACVKLCPMDIDIPAYIKNGQRVLSTECSLCQTCITVCAQDALKIGVGFDLGGKDLLRQREPMPLLTGRAVPVDQE